MADSIKADDSDVSIGADSGSDDIVAKEGDASATAGGDLAEVESVDLGSVEPPEVAPPPDPQPLPMSIDQIGQEVSEPGRQAEDVDSSRSSDEFEPGDLSFEALVNDLRSEYDGQNTAQDPQAEQGDFSAAVATARNALQSARGETIDNEAKRAGEYGEFVKTQREAEDLRQQTFQEREAERVNLLKDWNAQLDQARLDAKTRGETWNTFLGEQLSKAQARGNEWAQFLHEAGNRAHGRGVEWEGFMRTQREAAAARQARWDQFIGEQQARAADRQRRYDEWLAARQRGRR